MDKVIVYTADGVELHLNDGSKTLEEYESKCAGYLGDEWANSPSLDSPSAQ